MVAPELPPPPVLVLGLGSRLLGDDAVGLALAEVLVPLAREDERVEVLDGGTQGLALLGRIEGRRALLVLDACALGAVPGTVHRVDDPLWVAGARAFGAHGESAGELLAAASLLGVLPGDVALVGIEPSRLETGIGLSAAVDAALPNALDAAAAVLRSMLARLRAEGSPCTS